MSLPASTGTWHSTLEFDLSRLIESHHESYSPAHLHDDADWRSVQEARVLQSMLEDRIRSSEWVGRALREEI